MGLFDRSAVGAFRYTKDGRRLFVKRYLVADPDVDRVESRIRTSTIAVLFLGLIATRVADHLWGEAWSWLGLALMLPVGFLFRQWTATGLSVVAVPKAELKPVDRRAMALAEARAVGRPRLWLSFLLLVASAALGAVIAFTDGAWYGWFLLVVMAYFSVSLLWQLRLLSQARTEKEQPN